MAASINAFVGDSKPFREDGNTQPGRIPSLPGKSSATTDESISGFAPYRGPAA